MGALSKRELQSFFMQCYAMFPQQSSAKVWGKLMSKKGSSSVPEGKLMGVELIGVYKSGSINCTVGIFSLKWYGNDRKINCLLD